jgi:NAD+ kinase
LKKCYIVGNHKTPAAIEAFFKAVAFLESHNITVLRGLTRRSKIDFAVGIGGDGTILRLAAELARRKARVPILGINFGGVGALCQVQPAGMMDALQRAVNGEFSVVARMRLAVEVKRDGKKVFTADALNDVVFIRTRGGLARVDVIDNGINLNVPSGDGVIVATATGATAYNHTARGKLIHHQTELVITVISALDPTNASMITRSDDVIHVIPPKKADNVVAMEVDGPRVLTLRENDRVVVKKSPCMSYFMRFDEKSRHITEW